MTDFSFENAKLSVQPNIIKKNAEALLDASKEISLEVNSEKRIDIIFLKLNFNLQEF
jgi:hypothetical protein